MLPQSLLPRKMLSNNKCIPCTFKRGARNYCRYGLRSDHGKWQVAKMLLEAKKLDKTFNGVYALKGLDFSIEEGEIHGW